MGGGTVLVEATVQGRIAVGNDINSLAVFLARAKTRTYTDWDLERVGYWFSTMELRTGKRSRTLAKWLPYQTHLQSPDTWRIRKLIELALNDCSKLRDTNQELLARCIVLRTAQWALDCRRRIPSTDEFRSMLLHYANELLTGARQYAETLALNCKLPRSEPICLHASAVGIHENPVWLSIPRPRLVLTSPPYPGVHVLYHRWQVKGRRETAAPYWIANSEDGASAMYYTFGDRENPEAYFRNAKHAYRSIAQVCDPSTILVQMVAFAEPDRQLPRFLNMLRASGFEEIDVEADDNADGRVWRSVPNRKWYASQRGAIAASKELVLFHRLTQK